MTSIVLIISRLLNWKPQNWLVRNPEFFSGESIETLSRTIGPESRENQRKRRRRDRSAMIFCDDKRKWWNLFHAGWKISIEFCARNSGSALGAYTRETRDERCCPIQTLDKCYLKVNAPKKRRLFGRWSEIVVNESAVPLEWGKLVSDVQLATYICDLGT